MVYRFYLNKVIFKKKKKVLKNILILVVHRGKSFYTEILK